MKNLIFLFLQLNITILSAQQSEIVLGTSFFNNGNILSGTEITYYQNMNSRFAYGIRPSFKFDNKTTDHLKETSWSLDLVSRFKTSTSTKINTFVESGISFFRIRTKRYEAIRPTQSTLLYSYENEKYLGFVLGFTASKSIGKRFSLGLNYRAYYLIALNESTEDQSLFESNPNLLISYNF